MREFYCIVCPNGCRLKVEGEYRVTGNKCERGIDFAIAELTHPTRSISTTVRTAFPGIPALPVRSTEEIPKERVPDLIQFLKTINITKALGMGEMVARNPLGIQTNIIVTSNILKDLSP
ncbi:MAG: DUF1667 domain-containing protein [Treponema sp.]|jgi:CxxC motif-containing protein|nr:DUF1667 domain-containing protein [Treponema sp.]